MTYRVTNLQTTTTFIDQIFVQRRALEEAREQVSTGIRVGDASDDPARAGTISDFQSAMQRLTAHYERVTTAKVHLETQDSTLSQANDLLIRAKEIATEAANETVSPEVRERVAQEIFELRDTMVGLANTQYQGIYIYGGTDSNVPPFTSPTNATPPTAGYANPASVTDPAAAKYTYNISLAASGTRTVQVSDSDSVRINTPGGDVFSRAIAAVEKLGRALAGYDTDSAGTPPDAPFNLNPQQDFHLQTQKILESINALDTARTEDFQPELTSVGGRLNRVAAAEEIVLTLKLNTENARTSIQDVDIFEAASRMTTLETSFQGLLASGARINGLSLLNYL